MSVSLASAQQLTSRLNTFSFFELLFLFIYLGGDEYYDPSDFGISLTDEVQISWKLNHTTPAEPVLYLCSASHSPLHFLEMNNVEQTFVNNLIFYKFSVNTSDGDFSGTKRLSLLNPQDVLKACSGLKLGAHALPLGFEGAVLMKQNWNELDEVRLKLNKGYWALDSEGGYQAVKETPRKFKKGQPEGDKQYLLAAEGGENSEPEEEEPPNERKKEPSKSGEDPRRPPDRQGEKEKAEVLVSLEAQLFDLIQQPENIEFLAQQLMDEFSEQPEGLALFVQMNGLDDIVGLSQGYSIDVWRKLLLWLKGKNRRFVGNFLQYFYVGEGPDERLKRAIINAARQASVSNPQIFTHPVSVISQDAIGMFPGALPGFINQFVAQQHIPLPGQYSILTWVVILHWLQSHPGAVAEWMAIATMRKDWGRMNKLKGYIHPSKRPGEPGP
ncbi:hypothetical protein [Endozoicomonas arenosclerae]|uniref:hypothetical protein n=1 Tax=Endozoicomonas arenosclerae TaxID=1633495 RepID=UPI00078281E5|nr:hypothetical protein [Endozoicomonas arenosclerae]